MSTPLGCLFGDALAFLDGVVEIRLSVGMFDPCRSCGYVTGIAESPARFDVAIS
jgi:hypothetical protein